MQVSHRGFYSFKVDATSLVDPYDRHVSVMPEVYEVAMNSQISTPLSDTMGATLGGALDSHQSIPCRFLCAWGQNLAASAWLDM